VKLHDLSKTTRLEDPNAKPRTVNVPVYNDTFAVILENFSPLKLKIKPAHHLV
jgi:hypothetical protein